MVHSRVIEYLFFFIALGVAGLLLWQMFAPFITALALAAIIVVICNPLYRFIGNYITRGNKTLAALLSTVFVFVAVVTPISLVSSLLVHEIVSFYRALDTTGTLEIDTMFNGIETSIKEYIPGFDINLSEQIRQSVSWFASNIGTIFSGTVSVVFTFLIAMFGSFYLFRDGEKLVHWLISVSPLKDAEDRVILERITKSIRSVATGTVLVAILQGFLAAFGFALFGIDRAVLWGTVAALGALLPGVGTAGIMVPAVAYLFYTGAIFNAIGLTVWAIATIVIVDNILSPYLMSRGSNLHPFIILLSVLGGISLFGPIGFIIGPVMVSLFMVLLELYSIYVSDSPKALTKRK
jgi:predicted PurR-regulated permease PerM